MMNRLFSAAAASTPGGGAAAVDYDTYDLFADLPTEEVEVLPDYVTEVPRDILRHETVGLTLEEQLDYTRPEEEIAGRTLADDITETIGRALDRIFLAPLRLFFANLGFLVTGAAVLAGVIFASSWVLDTIMAQFQGSLF